jgi:prolipoprotein diacylglyceryltransferase
MFPTFSDFLAELFGINIPLPIQTFGLFMGIAFIVAAWIWGKELTRIYSIKNIQLNSKKIIVGKAATIEEYLVSGIFGFILGFKVLYIILNYKIFVADPPTELISLINLFLTILLLFLLSLQLL